MTGWADLTRPMPMVAMLDVVIAGVLVEGLALVLLHRARGWGLAPRLLLPHLAAGLALMLALRAAMDQAGWPWIALCLAASGLAHGLDLWRLWPRPVRAADSTGVDGAQSTSSSDDPVRAKLAG
jgi:hypothetical protein